MIQLQNFVSLTTTGTSGSATLSNGVLNVPNYSNSGTTFSTLYISTGDQSTTSNLASNVNGLSFSASANKRYLFNSFIKTNGVLGGIKFQITAPNLSTVLGSIFGTTASSSSFGNERIISINTLNSLLTFSTYTTVAQTNFIQLIGEVTTGANSGTVSIGFASGTNGNTSTIFQQGAYLQYLEI